MDLMAKLTGWVVQWVIWGAPYDALIPLACATIAILLIQKSRTPRVAGVSRPWVPKSPWDSPANWGLAYGQFVLPVMLFMLLGLMGAGRTEGDWAKTPVHEVVAISMVWSPIVMGALLTIFCRGRRLPIALCAFASSWLGSLCLLGFWLIGT